MPGRGSPGVAAFALVTPSQAELRLRRLVGSGCKPGGDGLRGTRYLPKARLLRAGGRYLPGCPWAALGAPCLHGVLLPDLLPSFPWPLSSLPLAWKGPGPAGTSAERDRFCTHPGLARVSPAWQQGPGFGVSGGGGGGLSPSRPVSLPRRRPSATSPPSVTQRLPVHQPHRWSCRGYRPNGLCRRVRILSWLPTPKLSCRGRRSRPQLITLDVPQGARVSARARGCSPAGSSSHLPPRPFARALPPPPPQNQSRSPRIVLFRGLRTNIPQSRGEGGKCRTMVLRAGGPAAPCVPLLELGGLPASPPLRSQGGDPLAEESCTPSLPLGVRIKAQGGWQRDSGVSRPPPALSPPRPGWC